MIHPAARKPQTPPIARYLGSARVERVARRSLLVALEDDARVYATLALAFPYQPAVGDRLLVIGDEKAFYAIGVLEGRGRAQLSQAAGISLRAEGGRLRLSGGRGIELGGARIRLQTEHLRRVALDVVQTFREQRTQIRERLQLEAGEVDELSRQRWVMQAKRVVVKALGGARIKSTTVRLG